MGGPIRKDKTFIFGTWDQLRENKSDTQLTTSETPELVNFMRANLANNISTSLLTDFPTAVSIDLTALKTVEDVMGDNGMGACTTTGPLGMPCAMPVLGAGTYAIQGPRPGLQWNVGVDHNFANGRDR